MNKSLALVSCPCSRHWPLVTCAVLCCWNKREIWHLTPNVSLLLQRFAIGLGVGTLRFMVKVRCFWRWLCFNCLLWLGTNLIHDFTAVTFSVKLAVFREKHRFPWNPWFFVNFSAFSLIYDNSRVLSAAFVRMLLFATCRNLALSSWHWQSWVLT